MNTIKILLLLILFSSMLVGCADVSTAPTTTPSATPTPTLTPTPTPAQPITLYEYEELVEYALDLINIDRVANGLQPIVLGNNSAAQKHAEERTANEYLSHWGMNGMKPYMRYTLTGGVNREAENCFEIEVSWSGRKDPTYRIDPKEILKEAQEGLMDSPGHRKTIIDKWNKKVNIGIAYNNERLDLVQQFEGDYIEFYQPPDIVHNHLVMAGNINLGELHNITIHYDSLPSGLAPAQLEAPPYDYAYSFGERVGFLIPPPPPDSHYIDLPSYAVVASIWNTDENGNFEIEANIEKIIERRKGVYTIVIWTEVGNEMVDISNYAIFLE